MCFSPEFSFASALVSIATLVYLFLFRPKVHWRLIVGVSYFLFMEILQVAQYRVIDECDLWLNKALTMVAWAHICFQPFVMNVTLSGISHSRVARRVFELCAFLSLLGAPFMLARLVLAHPLHSPAEWMAASRSCSYYGEHHVAWRFDLASTGYLLPAGFFHFFFFFMPLLVNTVLEKRGLVLYGIPLFVLFVGGPVLSHHITSDDNEKPAIWCLFSTSFMLLLIVYERIYVFEILDLPKMKNKPKDF